MQEKSKFVRIYYQSFLLIQFICSFLSDRKNLTAEILSFKYTLIINIHIPICLTVDSVRPAFEACIAYCQSITDRTDSFLKLFKEKGNSLNSDRFCFCISLIIDLQCRWRRSIVQCIVCGSC